METQKLFQNVINRKLERKNNTNNKDEMEHEWKVIKSNLADTANEVLQPKKKEIKKLWITDEILDLIDEWRKFNNRKDEEGKEMYKKNKMEN